jgi:hypothetical protein
MAFAIPLDFGRKFGDSSFEHCQPVPHHEKANDYAAPTVIAVPDAGDPISDAFLLPLLGRFR